MEGQGQAEVANKVLDLGDNCRINPLDKGMDRHIVLVLEERNYPLGDNNDAGPQQWDRLGRSKDRGKDKYFEKMMKKQML